jgi:hypothetical protein
MPERQVRGRDIGLATSACWQEVERCRTDECWREVRYTSVFYF